MSDARAAYHAAVARLEALGVMPDRPPSLETTREALARLSLSIDPRRVVVVAGTNGKGSTCAALETLLSHTGSRVGLYTSPHLVETTERIRVAGADVTPEIFVRAMDAVFEKTAGIRLTHFEALTLMAAWVFFSGKCGEPVDHAIFEVGLGGLWDSTNAIPHHYSVITALGLDHQNLLGPTINDIARNKLGIVSEGATVVHAPLPPETRELVRETRARTRSRWVECVPHGSGVDAIPESSEDEPRYSISTPWGEAPLALPGPRGAQNAAVALTLFQAMGFDPRDHLAALSEIRWAGRMQRLHGARSLAPVYLSGDHNPQGIASLLELLPAYPRTRLHVLAGVGKDKDVDGVLGPLSRMPDVTLYLTVPPFKGRTLEEYGEWRERAQGAWSSPAEAFAQVTRLARPGEMVLVTGSLYLVGEVIRLTRS